ncbi:MAG: hypothetical protein QOE57_270 [Acidimicrobiaceae bacterium]|nr:hypothetical protein [Acidimicrobiaceae bacterium]
MASETNAIKGRDSAWVSTDSQGGVCSRSRVGDIRFSYFGSGGGKEAQRPADSVDINEVGAGSGRHAPRV